MKSCLGNTATSKLRARGLLVLVTLLTIGCTSERGTTDTGATVSVCEVLGNPSLYRGKIVRVRGVFTYEGLRQDDCPKEFITRGRKWASVLNLASTQRRESGEPPFGFVTDYESWDRLDTTAVEAGKQGRPVEIWATVIGRFRVYLLPDGSIGGGYGHLGVLPAEIVVKRVEDIVVKPVVKSRYDYRLPKARAF